MTQPPLFFGTGSHVVNPIKNDSELLIFLPPLSESWGCRCTPLHLITHGENWAAGVPHCIWLHMLKAGLQAYPTAPGLQNAGRTRICTPPAESIPDFILILMAIFPKHLNPTLNFHVRHLWGAGTQGGAHFLAQAG